MASIFQPVLNAPDPRSAEAIQRPVRDESSAALVQGIETLAGVALEVQNQNIKKDFLGELKGVEDQELEFRRQEQELSSELLSAKDKSVINSVDQKLKVLERGEVEGTLSRSQADARRTVLLQQSMRENPWLATDLKALATASSGFSAGAADSPETRALDDRRERAVTNGITLAAQTEIDNYLYQKSVTVAQKEDKLANGTLNFPEFRNAFNSQVELTRAELFSQLFRAAEANPESIDQTDWTGFVSNAEAQLRRLSQQEQAKYSRIGILGDPERKTLDNDIKVAMAGIQAFANAKDKNLYLERMRKGVEDHGFNVMAKLNPFFAFAVSNGMENVAQKVAFDLMPKVQSEVAKHGSIDRINISAENGDPDSIAVMAMLDYNHQYQKMYHNQMMNGIPEGAGDLPKSITRHLSGKWLGLNLTPDEKTPEVENVLNAAVDRLTEGDAAVRELEWFLKPEVQLNLTPERIQKVKNRMDQLHSTVLLDFNRELTGEFPRTRVVKSGIGFQLEQMHRPGIWDPTSPAKISRKRELIDGLNTLNKLNNRFNFYPVEEFTARLLDTVNTKKEPVKESTQLLNNIQDFSNERLLKLTQSDDPDIALEAQLEIRRREGEDL